MSESTLDFEHPPAEPLPLVESWVKYAKENTELPNPNAMALSTLSPSGHPNSRIVLLKGIDERGPVFFTNRESAKGREIAGHPHVSLLFHWAVLERQIRIEGTIEPTTQEEDDAYYASRPRLSRIGAHASPQSQPIPNRAFLEDRVKEIEERYPDEDIPRPSHWGGFRVTPTKIEFWKGHPGRLHDRIVYRKTDHGWATQRLAP